MDTFVAIDLTGYYNNNGVTSRAALGAGRFNVWGNCFPAEELPSGESIVVGGVSFRFPVIREGQPDNVVCRQQRIAVPPDYYDWIYVLGAGERRSEDWLWLHYEDDADPEWLRVSDFWPPATARFGELMAFRCGEMHYPHHVQSNLNAVMFQQRVPVTRREILRQIRLPDNESIHLFAVTLAVNPLMEGGVTR